MDMSEIFPLDALYKVPNWIMRWGGSKMFDVLEFGLNEYGEIIMQHFHHLITIVRLKLFYICLKVVALNPPLYSLMFPTKIITC